MSDGAAIVASAGPSDLVQIIQAGSIGLATVDQINAAPAAQCAALGSLVVALTQRIAALEGKPDPCVALSGALPVATLQMGTTDLAVPVAGLLRTDTVSVELEADLPAGLDIRAVRPDRTRDGVLLVQATATLQVALTAAVPIRVTALR